MQFTDVIDRRRSIRAYSAKVVPKSKLDAVLATVQRAPSAGDLDKGIASEVALGQSFIVTQRFGSRGVRLTASSG